MALIKPFSWVGPWTGREELSEGPCILVGHYLPIRSYVSKATTETPDPLVEGEQRGREKLGVGSCL